MKARTFIRDVITKSFISAGIAAFFAPVLQYIYTYTDPEKSIDILQNGMLFASINFSLSANTARILKHIQWGQYVILHTIRFSIGIALSTLAYTMLQPEPTMTNLIYFVTGVAFSSSFINYCVMSAIIHLLYE